MPTPPIPAPADAPGAVPTKASPPAATKASAPPTSIRCRHSESDASALRCTRCRSLRCAHCCERRTIRLEPTWLCPCGGFCMPVPTSKTRATAGPVEDFVVSLAEPLQPGTRVRWGMATALLGVAAILASLPLLGAVGLVVSAIGHLYVVAWLLKIVRVTVDSPARATEWPDLIDPLPDLVWPFVRALVAGAIAFTPAIAGALFFFERGPHALGTWICLMAGCVVFPPVMAALGFFESFSALSPLLFARMIRRSPAHWAIASAFILAAVIVCLADGPIWSRVPYLGAFADAAVALYVAIAFARFLGRVVASLDAE